MLFKLDLKTLASFAILRVKTTHNTTLSIEDHTYTSNLSIPKEDILLFEHVSSFDQQKHFSCYEFLKSFFKLIVILSYILT